VRALASGLLLASAFLPLPLGWLAWFGLVPFLLALAELHEARAPLRRFFTAGYLFGFAFYLVGLHWVALMSTAAMTMPWLRYPAWIAASAYLALFGGLAALFTGWLARRARFAFPVAVLVGFLAVEELRGGGELGFPWFQLGYSQHAYLPVVQLASLGSVSLVTLWILLLSVLATVAIRRRAGRPLALASCAVALALPWAWGSAVLRAAPAAKGPEVALIQANIGIDMKWSPQAQERVIARFLRLSDEAMRRSPRPDLLIWPETATGSYLTRQMDQRLRVAGFLISANVPLFTGYPDYTRLESGALRYTNSAGMLRGDGMLVAQYDKRHLVPFGERLPFQWLFPALGHIDLGQAEWTPGRGSVLFPSAAGPFGCLICFESIYPDLARRDVRAGARWLVNITNDAWFGRSAALDQHAAMAVFRGVENHVALARCGNTGVTLVADPWGRTRARAPIQQEAIVAAAIAPPGPPTWFTRLGDWPLVLLIAALVVAAVRAAREGGVDRHGA